MNYPSAPIINQPMSLALPARIGWGVLAALLWSLWLGCWSPLVTVAIWELGLMTLRDTAVAANSWSSLVQLATPCVLAVAAQSTMLLCWAGKDYVLFHKQQRRLQSAHVDLVELALHGRISPTALANWQGARCLLALHDGNGVFQHAITATRNFGPLPVLPTQGRARQLSA